MSSTLDENPMIHAIKLKLSEKIMGHIHRNNLTHKEVAEILGIDRSKVSRIQLEVDRFTIDRLLHYSMILGYKFTYKITKPRST